MDEFLILLQAKLDEEKSKGNVNANIRELQNQLDKLKLQVELDPKSITNIVKQIESALGQKIKMPNIAIDTKTGQQIGTNIGQNIADGISKSSGKVNAEIQKIANQVNKIQLSMGDGTYESKVESLIAKTNQWTDANGNARISTNELSGAFDTLKTAFDNYANSPTEAHQKALIASEKELDKQIKNVTNSVRSMNAELAKDSKISSLHNQLADFMSKNGKTVRSFGNDLRDIFNQTAQGSKLTNQELAVLKQRFIDIQNVARNIGKLGKTFFQTIREGMSSFSYWTSSTFLVMKAIQSIKGGIGTVKALDTALVDLKKTTTMTSSELEDFYYASNKVAKQMGVTTEEIINQSSAWSRLGFSSGEAATKMAKLSSQFASISPGMDVDEATTSLVSMMRAYDVEVDDVLDDILSKINDVGNKFGTSNAEIAEGLRKSSAAMAAVGGTIESNIALFTGAQEIVQDASQVGNAIRSIALRVRSYDEETEEFSEDLANIKGEVIDLTKVASNNGQGISLFTDSSQTEYRDLVDYLGDISDIWDEIDAKSQNELLNKLFGKNRAQVGAAMIKNFDQIRAAIEVMENSAGSADREMSVIMDSLDYKLNRLSETGTSVAQNLFKRDDMKTVVDGLTSIMNVIDALTSKLGLFGSIGLGAGLFAGFKNVGNPKMFGFNLSKNIPTVC